MKSNLWPNTIWCPLTISWSATSTYFLTFPGMETPSLPWGACPNALPLLQWRNVSEYSIWTPLAQLEAITPCPIRHLPKYERQQGNRWGREDPPSRCISPVFHRCGDEHSLVWWGCITTRWHELPSAAAGRPQPQHRRWSCCSTSTEGLVGSGIARMEFAKAQAAAIPIRTAVPLSHHFRSVTEIPVLARRKYESHRSIAELTWNALVCVYVCSQIFSAPAHQWYVQHQENYEYIHSNPTFICFGVTPP